MIPILTTQRGELCSQRMSPTPLAADWSDLILGAMKRAARKSGAILSHEAFPSDAGAVPGDCVDC